MGQLSIQDGRQRQYRTVRKCGKWLIWKLGWRTSFVKLWSNIVKNRGKIGCTLFLKAYCELLNGWWYYNMKLKIDEHVSDLTEGGSPVETKNM